MKALDYLNDRNTKILILQDLCNFDHVFKVVVEYKSSNCPGKFSTSIQDIKSSDTVDVLKAKIRGITGTSPVKQQLLFGKRSLKLGETTSYYSIQSGYVILVERRRSWPILVFVKNL